MGGLQVAGVAGGSGRIRVPPPPEPIMSRLLIPAFVAIALACSACGPSAPPSDPTPSAPGPTAQTTEPSPSAPQTPRTPVTYARTHAHPAPVAWGPPPGRGNFHAGPTE